MKTKSIFRIFTFLGLATYILAFFVNLWIFQVGTQAGVEGLLASFPEDISLMFGLGGVTFSTFGATIVTISTIVGLASLCLFIIFSILNWCKVIKDKHSNIILLAIVILMSISAIALFVGGYLFTSQTASIQIPFTDTYFDVYMSGTIFFTILVVGAIWSCLFGFLSLIKRKNKQTKKDSNLES